jgi:arsenate reductase (thioredoxin)
MRSLGQLSVLLVGCAVSFGIACSGDRETAGGEKPVVFVCQRGAAKSVMAAALFNERASARKLPFRAEARGVVPDPAMMPEAVEGLRADGLTAAQKAPVGVAREDVERAAVVVAFDPIPADIAADSPIQKWDGVPHVRAGYAAARDAMLPRIDALLDDLARRGSSDK